MFGRFVEPDDEEILDMDVFGDWGGWCCGEPVGDKLNGWFRIANAWSSASWFNGDVTFTLIP